MLDRANGDDGANSGAGTALRDALRRARAEAAEQTDVVIDMRHAEVARLEILRDELEPIFAQVPHEIDIFDLGLAPGERPRLFVDMVAFVEMGRDRRTYQFVRDGRHGRAVVAESERMEPIVDAVTAYVARRLIERERLLVDDERLEAPWPASALVASAAASGQGAARPGGFLAAAAAAAAAEREAPPGEPPAPAPVRTAAPVPPRKRGWMRILTLLLAAAAGAAIGGVLVVGLIFAVAKGIIPL